MIGLDLKIDYHDLDYEDDYIEDDDDEYEE